MFRPVKIRQYLALMQAKGHAAEAVLADSGVSRTMLDVPDFLIDIRQSKVIVANMIALTGDQGIGLEIGSRTELTDLGLVGYGMMSSNTLRETVNYWLNYSNALVGMPMQVQLEEHAVDDWAFQIYESTPLGFVFNFCVEEQLVMICKLGQDLISARPIPTLIELSYPAPAHYARYRDYFGCPIRFNASCTRISFSSPALDHPLRNTDSELNALCARQCEMLLDRIGREHPLVARIKNILLRNHGHVPAVEDVATELNLSPRTLRRALREAGVGYQQLANDFRAGLAQEYLRSSTSSAKEIAWRLGFKDINSFRRAFKLWTGKTVQEYATENSPKTSRAKQH